MVRYTESQIQEIIVNDFADKDILILAPLVRSRKGHYRELFQQVAKKGYLRVRVDGEVRELTYNMQVDRYKVHDIELVVDRIRVNSKSQRRLEEAIKTAFRQGKGMLMVLENTPLAQPRYFSRMLMDPERASPIPSRSPTPSRSTRPTAPVPSATAWAKCRRLTSRS